ncbi:MAG TPA: signal peptidase II [Candidatus Atribacteria bacterium]|nr:signal peptidase II [Candidatus Atribacteria bacterium]
MSKLINKGRVMKFVGWTILVILLDQGSKFFIQQKMKIGESIPIIKGVFHITYIENPRTAFGIFQYRTIFFVIAILISVILIILISRKMVFKKDSLVYISLTLILGGAIGNLIDRVRTGRVIDFLDFRIWPIFNFADIAIVCGMLILVVYFLFYAKEENKE